MIKTKGLNSKAADYFVKRNVDEIIKYYALGEAGIWNDPKGLLKQFGIQSGTLVKPADFQALMENRKPGSKEPLNKNANKNTYRAGTDVEYSPCRDFSVLVAMASPEQRRVLEDILLEAAQEGLALLQEKGAYRTHGKGRDNLVKTDIVAGVFRHVTTRNLDPHWHLHMVVLNLTKDDKNQWRAIENEMLVNWATAADAAINASLMKKLKERFPALDIQRNDGLTKEDRGHAFVINNLPRSVIHEFSTRRLQMQGELDKLIAAGKVDASDKIAVREAMDRLWGQLRKAKDDGVEMAEVEADWVARAATHGVTPQQIQALLSGPAQTLEPIAENEIDAAVAQAMTDLLKTESATSESSLYRHVAENLYGRADAVQIAGAMRNVMSKEITHEQDVIKLKDRCGDERKGTKELRAVAPKGIRLVSTVEMERKEREIIETAMRMNETESHPLDPSIVADVMKRWSSLSNEQALAVQYVTKPSQFRIVEGIAGSGKTYMLDCVRDIYDANGYQLIGLSGAWKQAKELQLGSHIQSMSIAKFVKMVGDGKLVPHDKMVIVMDEAGMTGSIDAHAVQEIADKYGCKLIWTGEEAQLTPAGAGAPMTMVTHFVGTIMLEDIRRQKDAEDQAMVRAIRSGNAMEALSSLDSRGRLMLADNKAQMMQQVIADWAAYTAEHPDHSTAIICLKNSDKRELASMARQVLRDRGQLTGEDVEVQCAITTPGRNKKIAEPMKFAVGDPIVFRQNDQKLGVTNQDRGIIQSIRIHKSKIEIEVLVQADGVPDRMIRIDSESYKDKGCGAMPIESALAITTYASQGMSRDAVFSALDLADRRNAYIDLSRHKVHVQAYADASVLKARAIQAAARLGQPEPELTRPVILEQLARQLARNSFKISTQDIALEERGALKMTAQQVAKMAIEGIAALNVKIDQVARTAEKALIAARGTVAAALDRNLLKARFDAAVGRLKGRTSLGNKVAQDSWKKHLDEKLAPVQQKPSQDQSPDLGDIDI